MSSTKLIREREQFGGPQFLTAVPRHHEKRPAAEPTFGFHLGI
jgi:hypothetical protein